MTSGNSGKRFGSIIGTHPRRTPSECGFSEPTPHPQIRGDQQVAPAPFLSRPKVVQPAALDVHALGAKARFVGLLDAAGEPPQT